jgi:hypothetical protein
VAADGTVDGSCTALAAGTAVVSSTSGGAVWQLTVRIVT